MGWESDLDDVLKTAAAQTTARYDPSVSSVGYLANESKLVPAGLLGLPAETIANAMKLMQAGTGYLQSKITGQPPTAAFNTEWEPLGGVGTFARALGYMPLKAPGAGTEFSGDVMKAVAAALATRQMTPALSLPSVVATGAGAGTGAFAAREAFPNVPGAEMLGSQIGGVAPAISPTMNLIRAGRTMISPTERAQAIENATGKYGPIVEQRLREKIVRDVADELRAEPLAARNLAEAEALGVQVPGVSMDIGQASQTGSVAQRAKQAYRYSPQAIVEKEVQDRQNRNALIGALPQAQESTQVPFRRLLAEQSENMASLQDLQKMAERKAQDLGTAAKRLQPEDIEVAGATLKRMRATEKKAADAVVEEMSRRVDEAAGDTQFRVSNVVETAERALGMPIVKFDPANAPRVAAKIKDVMTRIEEQNKAPGIINPATGKSFAQDRVEVTVGIKDLRAMMEAVNQDIADVANSSSGVDRRQFRALTQIKRSINESVEQSDNAAARQAFAEFNKHYATEYAPRFLRGENIRQTMKNDLGVEVIPDEKVLGSYLKAGGSAQMRRFLDLYGERASARSLMESAVYDRYANDVVPDGVIDPKKHNKFMFNYGAQIRQLDKFGADIGRTLAERNTSTEKIIANQSALRQEFDHINNDAFVNALKDKFGALNIDDVMGDVVKDPRIAANLVGRMNQAEARGMVNWFAGDLEAVLSGANYGKLGDAITTKLSDKNYANAYKAALNKAYGKQEADAHLARIDAIQKIAGRLDATEIDPFIGLKGESLSANPDALQKAAGFTARSVFNLARAMIAGRNSPEDTAFVLATQFGTHRLQKMSNEITRQLLTDPALSQEIMTAMKNPPTTGQSWISSGWKLAKHFGSNLEDIIHMQGPASTAAMMMPEVKREAQQQ